MRYGFQICFRARNFEAEVTGDSLGNENIDNIWAATLFKRKVLSDFAVLGQIKNTDWIFCHILWSFVNPPGYSVCCQSRRDMSFSLKAERGLLSDQRVELATTSHWAKCSGVAHHHGSHLCRFPQRRLSGFFRPETVWALCLAQGQTLSISTSSILTKCYSFKLSQSLHFRAAQQRHWIWSCS